MDPGRQQTTERQRSRPPALALFVCRANVCRSPMMQFLVNREVLRKDPDSPWRFISAGTAAHPGDQMCSSSAGVVGASPEGTEFVRRHAARVLDAGLVDHADIILTASLAERAVVAQLAPEARSRTFTILEASLLAEAGGALRADQGRTAQSLAEALHAARGSLSGIQTRGSKWRRNGQVTGQLDIPDVHQGESRNHRQVVKDVQRAGQQLAALFAAYSEAPAGRWTD
jgi:protein-tyrosine phosphatase